MILTALASLSLIVVSDVKILTGFECSRLTQKDYNNVTEALSETVETFKLAPGSFERYISPDGEIYTTSYGESPFKDYLVSYVFRKPVNGSYPVITCSITFPNTLEARG
jgi:hypothetical protein